MACRSREHAYKYIPNKTNDRDKFCHRLCKKTRKLYLWLEIINNGTQFAKCHNRDRPYCDIKLLKM